MMHADAERFLDEVLGPLWPDYEPTGRIGGLWAKILLSVDWDVAEQAAEELKLSKFVGKVPDPGKFREIASKLTNGKKGTVINSGSLPANTVFVMCTVSECLPAGTFFPVHVLPVTRQHEEDFLVNCAQAWIDGTEANNGRGLKKLYGGEWVVYRFTNRSEMRRLQLETQANNPKPKFKGNLGLAVANGRPVVKEVDEFDAFINKAN